MLRRGAALMVFITGDVACQEIWNVLWNMMGICNTT